MTVDLGWIELPLGVDEAERHSAAGRGAKRHGAVETTLAPSVAGSVAALLDLEPNGILVAVRAHLDDALDVAALLALPPQPVARTRPVIRLSRLDGAGQGGGVHVGEHQHFAGL